MHSINNCWYRYHCQRSFFIFFSFWLNILHFKHLSHGCFFILLCLSYIQTDSWTRAHAHRPFATQYNTIVQCKWVDPCFVIVVVSFILSISFSLYLYIASAFEICWRKCTILLNVSSFVLAFLLCECSIVYTQSFRLLLFVVVVFLQSLYVQCKWYGPKTKSCTACRRSPS